ncbi:Uncharacterized protein Adt_31494 [Abeliophyllum distichum]|uniref:Ubiquitin-like protease family profile domain-containing protein n=1 Tax=Abeliophyllum distichum TaxID=126358 RepID=A0ABD1RE91_9LAMI
MKFCISDGTRATSTDCFFDFKLKCIYDKFVKDQISIDKDKSLFLYLTRQKIWFIEAWGLVEHIFIPVFIDKRAHWILLHFDTIKWQLDVYNSSFKTIRDVAVLEAIELIRTRIPHLLRKLKVLQFVPPDSQLPCRIYKDIRQQTNKWYAEYIFQNKINEMSKNFDTRAARHNIAVQLFKYAIEKPNQRFLGLV